MSLSAPDGFSFPGRMIEIDGQEFVYGYPNKMLFNNRAPKDFIDNKVKLMDAMSQYFHVPETLIFSKKTTWSSSMVFNKVLERIQDPDSAIKFPIILKPDHDSRSRGVNIISDQDALYQVLSNLKPEEFRGDNILVQQCINSADEYRALFFKGKCYAAYSRYPFNNILGVVGDDERHLLQDSKSLSDLDKMAAYLYNDFNVEYIGLDVRRDREGALWVLEGNSSPMGLDILENEIPDGMEIVDSLSFDMIAFLKEKAAQMNARAVPNYPALENTN